MKLSKKNIPIFCAFITSLCALIVVSLMLGFSEKITVLHIVSISLVSIGFIFTSISLFITIFRNKK